MMTMRSRRVIDFSFVAESFPSCVWVCVWVMRTVRFTVSLLVAKGIVGGGKGSLLGVATVLVGVSRGGVVVEMSGAGLPDLC
jgi:hypothetical protein